MTPPPTKSLEWLLAAWRPECVTALVHRTRRDAGDLETYVTETYAPDDPRRQRLRQAIRHLAETPDTEWPQPIRPQ